MPPYYFTQRPIAAYGFRLVSLHRLKSSFEPLMKLREITSVSQHRLDQGFKENPFRKSRPASAANDFDQLHVLVVARKVGNSEFHLAESPLESLNLIRGCFRL